MGRGRGQGDVCPGKDHTCFRLVSHSTVFSQMGHLMCLCGYHIILSLFYYFKLYLCVVNNLLLFHVRPLLGGATSRPDGEGCEGRDCLGLRLGRGSMCSEQGKKSGTECCGSQWLTAQQSLFLFLVTDWATLPHLLYN